MAGEKASFYSRDPSSLNGNPTTSGSNMYVGEERRRSNRRSSDDRRGEVRFDLNGDRRQSGGRREKELTAQFW